MTQHNPIGVISMFYARPFGREHFAIFPRIKRAGLDFIELLVPEPGELDLAETRKALKDNGLGVVMTSRVNATRDLAATDKAIYDAGVRYLEANIDAAKGLGATIAGGPIFGAPLVFAGRAPAPVSDDEKKRRVDQVVKGLKAVGKRAESEGVVFAVEPVNRYETDFANTSRQVTELVEMVGSKGVGIMLDTFHMSMEEAKLDAAIQHAAKHLVHFQANENNRGFVGTGQVDWALVARTLKAINYRGPITLEPFRRDSEALSVPLAQWRAPHRNEDKELADSTAYLKRALAEAGA
jgi:D-psicose/D-tagatose/L-ribulose 3-epimerase